MRREASFGAVRTLSEAARERLGSLPPEERR
jgi:hypothetical protein